MTSNEHVLDLLPGYVLDCLDEDDLILVSEHLAGCPSCQAELPALQATVDQLAFAVPLVEPSDSLRGRLVDEFQSSQPVQLSWWQQFKNVMQQTSPVWGLAGIILILLLGVTTLLLWQRVNRLEVADEIKALRTVALIGTETVPGAIGLIVLSVDGDHGTLVVDGLPELDSGQQYQLWLIDDGQRTSGGVFSADEHGYGSLWVSSPVPLASYSSFGVSIEPAGGSLSPTGEKVLGGTFD
jgi:hypothetical protein